MGILMIFIGCTVAIVGIIFYCVNRTRYTSWYEEGKPCLSFEEFVSFYNVNPGKWEIQDGTDLYDNPCSILIYYAKGDKLIFSWKTDRDRKDYLEWKKNKERQERDIKTAETLAKLTKNVRKDIEFYEKKAQNETQETYNRILKMMEEE